jgi:predicted permease
MDILLLELRRIWRNCKRRPASILIAIISLGLAMAASAAIFSIYNVVMLKTSRVARPEKLYRISLTDPGGFQFGFTFSDLNDIRNADCVESASLTETKSYNVGIRNDLATGTMASKDYFRTIGVPLLLGRYIASDDEPGVLLSYSYYRYLGHTDGFGMIEINGINLPVLGVLAEGYNGLPGEGNTDFWISPGAISLVTSINVQTQESPNQNAFFGILRIKNEYSIVTAKSRLDSIVNYWLESNPSRHGILEGGLANKLVLKLERSEVNKDDVLNAALPQKWMMIGAAGALLLIAILNVSGLHLARALSERRERALRRALGANFGQTVIQALAESIVMALPSGALALILGANIAILFARYQFNSESVVFITPSVDIKVIAFVLITAIASNFIATIIPVLQLNRRDLLLDLNTNDAGDHKEKLKGALIIGQVGLSLLLVSGAGLAAASMRNVMKVNLGYNPKQIWTFDYQIPKHLSLREGLALQRIIMDRSQQLHGISGVSSGSHSPMDPVVYRYQMRGGQRLEAVAVWPGWISLLGGRIAQGRDFIMGDAELDNVGFKIRKIIINESLCRQIFGSDNPIGSHLGGSLGPEIVGVVKDFRMDSPTEMPKPMVLLPAFGLQSMTQSLVVRLPKNAQRNVVEVKSLIQGVDSSLVVRAQSLDEKIRRALASRALILLLLGPTAFISVILMASGLYGLENYFILIRTKEIGIRMALGATPRIIYRHVIMSAYKFVIIGVMAGWFMTGIAFMLLKGLIYGISPVDPILHVSSLIVIVVATAISSYFPARRAVAVDPAITMKNR